MSKSVYAGGGGGGARRKNARENYLEQLSYGRGLSTYADKKRKPFTQLRSFDDTDLAYRSTSDYLRQSKQEPPSIESLEMMLTRTIPRTKSASEMTPRNQVSRPASGNPRYKAQEDYYDDIQALKKELKSTKEENSNLRAKNRRLEEDNVRKRKEIDTLYDPTKDGDLRRTFAGSVTDRNNSNQIPTANVVISLKQRIFKLESQIKQKENKISEIEADPRWTRSTELEIQNRALMGELERQKVERLNLIQNDYTASLEEEKKNAVKILEHDKRQLKDENKRLKEKLQEMDKTPADGRSSSRHTNRDDDPELSQQVQNLTKERQAQQGQLDRLQDEFDKAQTARDQYRRQLREMNTELEESKRERDEYRTKFNRTQEELDDLKRGQHRPGATNATGRSSPVLKRDDEPLRHSRVSSPRGSMTALPRDPQERGRSELKLNTSFGKLNNSRSPNSSFTKASPRGLRDDGPKGDRKKNNREHHAAVVIQRSWRRHGKAKKSPLRDSNKLRNENLDKWSSKVGSTPKLTEGVSARSASKDDLLGSGNVRSRPTSANTSNDAALKIVQASLRGLLNRNDLGKPSNPTTSPTARPRASNVLDRPPQIDSDDDDIIATSARPSSFDSEKMRGNSRDQVKPGSTEKFAVNSKTALPTDKRESSNRFPPNFREPTSKTQRASSPPVDSVRAGSPQPFGAISSKQALPNDRNKLGSTSRFAKNDRDALSTPLPSSPLNSRSSNASVKKDNPRLPGRNSPEIPPRQAPAAKSPSGSRTSLQKKTNDTTFDDDDDVEIG